MRAVSHLSVVQDLRDVARDRSFKHVFLGVGVTRIRNNGVLYFRNAPSLESLWDIRGQGGIIINQLATAPTAKCGMTQCPMASDTGHEARSFTYEASDELADGVGQKRLGNLGHMTRPAKDTHEPTLPIHEPTLPIHEPTLPIHEPLMNHPAPFFGAFLRQKTKINRVV